MSFIKTNFYTIWMSRSCREHDIAFLSQTYADLEAVNRELENERERHKVDLLATK